MFKHCFLLLFSISAFIACKKSKTPTPADLPPTLDSARVYYMVTDARLSNTSIMGITGDAHFTYENGRIIRRTGGHLPLPPAGVVPGPYTKEIYDVVQYHPDKIFMETRTELAGYNIASKRELLLENGRLKKKIYTDNRDNRKDTVMYLYDNNNRIQRREMRNAYETFIQVFSFDGNGNLQSVRSTSTPAGAGDPSVIIEETFQNYDNRPNPLKGYWMWDDMYYRSLSVNNFAKYNMRKTIANGTLGGNSEARETVWQLRLDAKGNVDFSN